MMLPVDGVEGLADAQERNNRTVRRRVSWSPARLISVVRKALRNSCGSAMPISSRARNASMFSDNDTRMPLRRNTLANSMTRSSIVLAQRRVLAANADDPCRRWRRDAGLASRRDKLLSSWCALRMSASYFISADSVWSTSSWSRCFDIEQGQSAHPIEALADARGLLQIQLAQAVQQAHDFLGELVADIREL